jgi:hypothetical protein
MRPVLPPCSTEALKIRYAALGGVLSGDGWRAVNGPHPSLGSCFGTLGTDTRRAGLELLCVSSIVS